MKPLPKCNNQYPNIKINRGSLKYHSMDSGNYNNFGDISWLELDFNLKCCHKNCVYDARESIYYLRWGIILCDYHYDIRDNRKFHINQGHVISEFSAMLGFYRRGGNGKFKNYFSKFLDFQ
jgi:hypothetical protein